VADDDDDAGRQDDDAGRQDDDAGDAGGQDDSGKPATLEAALEQLDAERRAHSATRKEATKHRRQRGEAERELEQLRTQGLSDAERVVAEAKRAGRDEAEGEWRDRYLREAVTAAAGGKLRDPDDAYGLLEAAGELGELRELEPEKMRGAAGGRVDKLLEAKPYLAAEDGGREPARGALTGGVQRRLSGREGGGSSEDTSAWLRRAARRGRA
jgi:hypothetical protein